MSSEQTIEKMRKVKLGAMAEAYKQQLANPSTYRDLGFDERLAMLIDYESDVRDSNKVQRLISKSEMYYKDATPEQMDYSGDRASDKEKLLKLFDSSYISKSHSIVLEGASGAGKTWIACALGTAACRKFHAVKYYKMRALIDELLIARNALDGSYQKLMASLHKTPLLIIDDFLLHEVSVTDMGELLELIDVRLWSGSTIFCSQYKVEGWIKIIGRTPITEAFMSRVQASSYILDVKARDDKRINNKPQF